MINSVNRIEHFKNVLDNQRDGNARLNVIYSLVSEKRITYKLFVALLKYNREIDLKVSKGETNVDGSSRLQK